MSREGKLISFPTSGSAVHPSALARAADKAGEVPFAFLSLAVRRVPAAEPIPSEVAARVLNRCVVAVLEALSSAGVVPVLSGTGEAPAIEVRFDGPDPVQAATQAGAEACGAVRRSQRAHEREFQAHVGVAGAREATGADGSTRVIGRPDVLARRLRDEAPPGQVVTQDVTETGP